MNIKKLAIGAITGGILFFFLGWLIYANLLADYMKNNPGAATGVDTTKMDMMYLAIGNLLSGILIAYIFLKSNINTLAGGLVTGAVIGLLMAASYDCVMYGTSNILSKKMMLADVLAMGAMWAVAGAVVGMVLGKLK